MHQAIRNWFSLCPRYSIVRWLRHLWNRPPRRSRIYIKRFLPLGAKLPLGSKGSVCPGPIKWSIHRVGDPLGCAPLRAGGEDSIILGVSKQVVCGDGGLEWKRPLPSEVTSLADELQSFAQLHQGPVSLLPLSGILRNASSGN